MYIKYVSQLKKEIEVSFISTCSIPDDKADTITNKVIETLDTLGLKTSNLVGLGSDRAAVMIGKHKGVAKDPKDKTNGLMVNSHCINQKLALASAKQQLNYKRVYRRVERHPWKELSISPAAPFRYMLIISCLSKLFSAESSDQNEAAEVLFDDYSKNGSPETLNYENTKLEWQVASKMLHGQAYKEDLCPKQTLLKLTTPDLQETFPNLAKLVAVGLSIPVSIAECERRFSALKQIKTCLRNHTNQNTLNNLTIISLEGSDLIDFDFEKCADNWASKVTVSVIKVEKIQF
ncbi:hypothetical protein PR048_011465 [Dryococelus australis]|uniref:HAT C-terminal dimerisation domain-containing protein n=1 Tax=Dryococelus australis TaxID=614101 RepID=A0ABQ9HLN6_9NEOP|nr:hypothetical protein PR048_011465 [Dryococelus australis]